MAGGGLAKLISKKKNPPPRECTAKKSPLPNDTVRKFFGPTPMF